MLRAADIHARIADRWREVLMSLGVPAEVLRKRAGPCPACGGKDRFTFDNRNGRGDFFCRGCGAGDGFGLLMRVNGWEFKTALQQVITAADLGRDGELARSVRASSQPATHGAIAEPSRRVLQILRESCSVEDCEQALTYLASRNLIPLPPRHGLRAHAGAEYFEGKDRVGKFAALIAPVRDRDGELVTVHVTYLEGGRKLAKHEPRKQLSPVKGRIGCAVRLMPLTGDALGIGEGIETCLAAATLNDLPAWSALNTALLAQFEPPQGVRRLVIFADNDAPGLLAAAQLMQRLQGRVHLELHPPHAPAKDWADRATARK